MIIPTAVTVPIFIVSFILLVFQYYRINPAWRLLNMHFGLMLGAIVLMLLRIILPQWLGDPSIASMVLLALALIWFGLALLLFRFLPPPKH